MTVHLIVYIIFGIVIFLSLVVCVSPFILSSRLTRMEERQGETIKTEVDTFIDHLRLMDAEEAFQAKKHRAKHLKETEQSDHECSDKCVCPIHNTMLLWSPSTKDHACQDMNCVYGHGGITEDLMSAHVEPAKIGMLIDDDLAALAGMSQDGFDSVAAENDGNVTKWNRNHEDPEGNATPRRRRGGTQI